MRAIVLFFLISGMLSACDDSDKLEQNNADTPEKELQIVSTIKPIQAIVLAIAGEHAQSEQIIPDYASPHHFNLKPSDIRKVKGADVIFRIDEHMESQLNEVFENAKNNETGSKLISLAEIKDLKLIPSTGVEHHEHENVDFHIWTSPQNAVVIAKQVSITLSELDQQNATNYQQNFEKFNKSVIQLTQKISNSLEKYKNSDYIVFHDSWQYFANQFGLKKPIVVDLHEEVSSGAKTVSDILEKIEKQNIRCIFYDSSISESRLKLFSSKINAIKIDVLAQDLQSNQTTYIRWLEQMAQQIESCLSQ